MAVQNDDTIVTKGDLKNLYANKIAPYLGANMQMQVGASDYYSTDERIVGVWKGKPLYQKTYDIGVLPNATSMTVAHGITDLDEFVNINGIVKNTSSKSYYAPIFHAESANNWIIDVHANDTQISIVTAANWSIYSGYVTLQYTKTTDTANSVATTVGCYDPTRPDQWLENTEIYFGNGLYGKKFTGTTPASGWTTVTISTGISGTITVRTINAMFNYNNGAFADQYHDSSHSLWSEYANSNIVIHSAGNGFGNLQYEIIMTYTK